MIFKRFLPLLIFTLFNISAYSQAQYYLIKDFDGGAKSSFEYNYSGILYSVGTKIIVQYDSVLAGEYTGKLTLAAVDAAGNSQLLAVSPLENFTNLPPFSSFKTLPDGRVAFIEVETINSFKIIITDGTTAGTVTAYSGPSVIRGLEYIDSGLYFTYDGNPNHYLMKIEVATLAVSQVNLFGYFQIISEISKVSNTALIFMAPDVTDGNILKLYVSDGTASGTTALAVIAAAGSDHAQNTVMTQVGNKVYFFYHGSGEDCCNDLWVTDGTIAGTHNLKEFNFIYSPDFVRRGKALAWNNKFYFAATPSGGNINSEESLWVSDGTVSGTIRLNNPADYKNPTSLTVFKEALYFSCYGNSSTHTHAVNLNSSGMFSISPSSIATDGSLLFLSANNALYGIEVFQYDGINAHCNVSDGLPGPESSYPRDLFVNQGQLYFVATLSATGFELYSAIYHSIPTDTKGSTAHLFSLYPNPANNQLTIKSSEPIVSFRLISQTGTVLSETTDTTMSVASYSEGVYFVEVMFENGTSRFEKLILMK